MNFIQEHYRHKLPTLLGVDAVTLDKHIYYRQGKDYISERLRRHEQAHVNQYLIYGKCRFIFQYVIEYCIGRLKGLNHQKAYLAISFEVKAREAERV